MSNIALIGNKEIIIGFHLVGFGLFPATKYEEAIKALKECNTGNYSIVFITNEIAQTMIKDIEEYQRKTSMTICILPNRTEETALSMNILRKNVEKAVGTDILFKKEV